MVGLLLDPRAMMIFMVRVFLIESIRHLLKVKEIKKNRDSHEWHEDKE
jgi:hypothetical protein